MAPFDSAFMMLGLIMADDPGKFGVCLICTRVLFFKQFAIFSSCENSDADQLSKLGSLLRRNISIHLQGNFGAFYFSVNACTTVCRPRQKKTKGLKL